MLTQEAKKQLKAIMDRDYKVTLTDEQAEELGVALFVGIAAGTYSSIFIATPLLTDFKEREPAMQALARRVEQKQAAGPKADKKAKSTAATTPGEPVAAVASAPAQAAGKRQQPARKSRSKKRR